MSQISSHSQQTDDPFPALRRQLSLQFAAVPKDVRLFTTDAQNLYALFLDHLSPDIRQTYQCHACRDFFNRYGGLVTIDALGQMTPLWPMPHLVPEAFVEAVNALRHWVLNARVTGVFLSPLATWGIPESPPTPQGHVWTHLYVAAPVALRYPQSKLTAGQTMAEKREDHRLLGEAVGAYPLALAQQAVAFLETEQFYRDEKVLGVAQWFVALHESLAQTQHRQRRNALLWRAVASAPPGWCHLKTTMIGTLFDDMASGLSFAECTRNFAAKMHPLRYQRPQAPPAEGALERAEQLVATLGVAQSLERRFATMADIQEFLWQPHSPASHSGAARKVFAHLRPTPLQIVEAGRQAVTWRKFSEKVMPAAVSMRCFIPATRWAYVALVTATHAEAPPILQWDHPEQRNPVSWYFYREGATPERFNLQAGVWQEVQGIIRPPAFWGQGTHARHFSEGCIFLLRHARDLNSGQGIALLPEMLRAEYREIRAVIEAHSRTQTLSIPDDPPVCGVGFQKGGMWDIDVAVITSGNVKTIYTIDRWD